MLIKPEEIGEQYIELPRDSCDVKGSLFKGQKSVATKTYQIRYKEACLITHSFPLNWTPDSVILEGMFIINDKPLHSQKIMSQYGSFLIRRFILPYFHKGCEEVHLLFDNVGQKVENPKVFEQASVTRLLLSTCALSFLMM